MNKESLEEKVGQAKATPFSPPKEVSCHKTRLPDGLGAYVFRHSEIGELGRLIIIPHSSGQIQFSCEVVGEPSDPMTQRRQEILEPLTKALLAKMGDICGEGSGEPKPYTLQKKNQCIKSQVIPCEHCGVPTALLIFAPDATTSGQLEDYARMMYSNVKELNVPTWILGAEEEVNVGGEWTGSALTLKIWPKRRDARSMLAIDLDAKLDELMAKHCV